MPRRATVPELGPLVGSQNAQRLRDAGVGDLAWLLRIARTPQGRDQLARETGIPAAQLLEWAHLVDLCRIEGIDPDCAALLQKAGVRGLRDLVASTARALHLALRHLDSSTGLDPRTLDVWIRAARELRPAAHDTPPPSGEAWPDGLPIDGLGHLEGTLPRGSASAGHFEPPKSLEKR